MILYSKKKILFDNRVIALLGTDGQGGDVCYYVDRSTYTQAAILAEKYDNDPTVLLKTLMSKLTEVRIDMGLLSICKDSMPDPLSILSAFLCFIPLKDSEYIPEVCTGILSQLSDAVNFLFITKTSGLDSDFILRVSQYNLRDYEASWERFLASDRVVQSEKDGINFDVLKEVVAEAVKMVISEIGVVPGGTVGSIENAYNGDTGDDGDWVDPFAGLLDEDITQEFDSVGAEGKEEESIAVNETGMDNEVEDSIEDDKPKVKSESEILDEIIAKMNA